MAVAPPYFGGATGIPGLVRAMGFPQIGVNGRNGHLYLTWSDYRNGDVDVFFSRSVDRGRTWSAARRVSSDRIHNGKDQFFQWLAVDPVRGDLYVQFYDRRADSTNRKTTMTLPARTGRRADVHRLRLVRHSLRGRSALFSVTTAGSWRTTGESTGPERAGSVESGPGKPAGRS
ncbi:MAG: sialidase family protein [Gemmatimonadales bacterium]